MLEIHEFMIDFVFNNECGSITHDSRIFNILAGQFREHNLITFRRGFLDCLNIRLI